MKNYGVRFGSGDPRTFTGLSPTFLFFVNMATGATVTPPSIAELFANTGVYNFSWGTTTPIAFLVDAATTTPGANGRYVSGQLDPSDRGDEYAATMIAIGTSQISQGVSILAFGSSLTAFGVTSLAYSSSQIALGTSTLTQLINTGATLWVIGTSIYGQGVSMNALGVTILSSVNNNIAGIGSTASSFGTASTDPVDLFGYLKRIQENLEGNNTYNKVSGAFTMLSRGSSYTLANKTITNSVSLVTKS